MAQSRPTRIFLPEIDVDGIGSALLPARITGVNRNAQVLLFKDQADPRLARLTQVLKRARVSIISQRHYPGGYAVFLQPGAFLGRDQWSALGIREHRLTNANRVKDIMQPGDMLPVYRDLIGSAGIEEEDMHPRLIGLNRFGDQVYHGLFGRTLAKGDVFHGEWQAVADGRLKGDLDPAAFFRANSPETFRQCATNVASMIARGERMTTARITQIHHDMLDGADHLHSEVGYRLIDLQEEIETQAARQVVQFGRRGEEPRAFAERLNANLAEHKERDGIRISLQQFSTPFPVGRVAFEVTLPQSGQSVLEPTIGNGALISAFVGRGLNITGIELDELRAKRVTSLVPGAGAQIFTGDFMDVARKDVPEDAAGLFRNQSGPQFDVVVTNPPFETYETKSIRKDAFGRTVTLRRLDHEIAFEALQHLKADGRAFLVLPGDMIKEGELSGARRFFDNYLRSTYHVAGSACLDGRLYRKMGANFPVLLYALGPRREKPLTDDEIRAIEPESLQLLMSFDELYGWADTVRETMLELTGLPASELGYEIAPSRQALERSEPYQPASVPATGRPAGQPQPEPQAPSEQPAGRPDRKPEDEGQERSPGSRKASSGNRSSADGRQRGSARNPRSVEDGSQLGEAVDAEPAEATAPGIDAAPVSEPAPAATPDAPAQEQTTPSDGIAASVVLIDDLDEDPFVRTYEPFSEVGVPRAQIQKSLQGLIYRALLDVQSTHGNIDEFVAGKLDLQVSDLERRLSPEQIDALALNFARHAEGRGFLCGDLMGVGKGRFLAATAVAALAEDRPLIFMTEAPNLFSDFISRDLAEVAGRPADVMESSGYLRPFIFNQSADAPVRLEDGKTVVFKTGDIRSAKDAGLPADCNIVLATYSQFQSAHGGWKQSAILAWARNMAAAGRAPHFILDESHKAAGEASRTGDMITELVDKIAEMGGTITYSSATAIKSGRNIGLYSAVLPDTGMSVGELTTLIEENPLALQEVLSSEMASSGSMICRELDMRGVTRGFVALQTIDPDRHMRVVNAVDRVASFLRELVNQAPVIDAAASKLGSAYAVGGGDAARKVSVQTTSPVAQFHAFSQYLMVAVKNCYARDLLIDAIAQGRKPLFVYENTGKAVMERLAARIGREVVVDGINRTIVDRLPNMGDVLIENAYKLLDAKITDTIGNEHHVRLREFEHWVEDFSERVQAADLSLLTLDPIDQLREHCQELGLSMGELTRRSIEARKLPDGTYEIGERDLGQKQAIVREFNYGDLDVLVLNRSAASGISAHASPAVGPDLRPRRMIKMQLQSEITSERQIDGRIHRYGAVHPAEYAIPMSGFAADDRLCQLFNRKNRSLTATTNASRENRTNIDEASDLMNGVGEGVVREYLGENPHICYMLGLPNPRDENTETSGYAKKLMGRLVLLPVAKQEEVLSEIDTIFKMRIEALDAKGVNPLKLTNFDLRAIVEPEATLQAGDDSARQIGKRPLTLVKLTYKESREPIRAEAVKDRVKRGREAFFDTQMGRYVSPSEMFQDIMRADGTPDWAAAAFDKAFSRRIEDISMGMKPVDLADADQIWRRRHSIDRNKATVAEKRVLRAGGYATFLAGYLENLEPGRLVNLSTKHWPDLLNTRLAGILSGAIDGEIASIPAVITSVKFDQRDPLNIGAWKFNIAIPGEEWMEQVSLSAAFAHEEEAGSAISAFADKNILFASNEGLPVWAPVIFDDAHRKALDSIRDEIGQDELDNLAMSISPDLYGAASEADPFSRLIDLAFDHVPGGETTRHKYALEGNMFMAVKLTQVKGDRLGQKAIYTTATGDIRHAVILKSDVSIEKMRLQLSEKIQGLATPLAHQKRPEMVEAFVSLAGMLEETNTNYYYVCNGLLQDDWLRQKITGALSLVLSGGLQAQEIDDYVSINFDDILHEALLSLKSSVTSSIFTGNDVFGEFGPKAVETMAVEFDCYALNRKRVEVSQRIRGPEFSEAASRMTQNDIQVLMLGGELQALFHKKSSCMADVGSEYQHFDPLRAATKKCSGFSLKKGTLCLTVAGDNGSLRRVSDGALVPKLSMLAQVLHRQAKANDLPIMLKGGAAHLQQVIEKHASKAREYALEQRLGTEHENTSTNRLSAA